MSVKIHNYNLIKDIPGVFEADVAGLSIAGLLDYLESRYNSGIKEVLLSDGELGGQAVVSINGITASDQRTLIPDESTVAFSYLVLGG